MAGSKQLVNRALRFLRRRGLADTARRTALHFSRRRDDHRYLRRTRPGPEELRQQRETVFSRPLRFSVVVPLYNTPMELLREMIDSVLQQSYQDWELCLADGSDASHGEVEAYCREAAKADPRVRYQKLEKNLGISGNSNASVDMAEGEYIALLDHDDLLMPNALFEMRSAIEKTNADFLYSDEVIFRSPNQNRVVGIRLKPSFSPDSLLSNNYICHLTVFSKALWERAGGFRSAYDGSQDHDLILRLTNGAKGIAHISKVLYQWRSVPSSVASDINSKRYAIEAGRSAVEDFLRTRQGIDAKVESVEVFPTMYRVRYPIEGCPTVRVVLDAGKGDVPEERLRQLKETSGWDACEWTILSEKSEAQASPELKDGHAQARAKGEEHPMPEEPDKLASKGVSVHHPAGRAARWAQAAREAREDYLLFVDGIPEAMAPGWLRELLSLAQRPHIGAAGPKVLFEDGDVRHAGVISGMGPEGIAGRLYFRGDGESEDAFFGQLAVVEDVSAVTDCLMVSRRKYEEVGGFDLAYADALFDVDLCLRLLEKGYYNVCTPHARLKMGRAKEFCFDVGKEYASWPQDKEVFRKKNAKILEGGDPFYHPALSRKYENWRIK